MTPLDLPALDRMEAEATPGPFVVKRFTRAEAFYNWVDVKACVVDKSRSLDDFESTTRNLVSWHVVRELDVTTSAIIAECGDENEARRICAMLNAWPSLSARMRAMQEEIEASRAILKTHGHHECSVVVQRANPPSDAEIQAERERGRRLVLARARTDALAEREGKDADGAK